MTDSAHRPEDRLMIDAFVDGTLDDERQLAVRQQLEQDGKLRDEVASLNAVDERLKQSFSPPDLEHVIQNVHNAARQSDDSVSRTVLRTGGRTGWTLRQFVSIAASVAIAAVGIWLIATSLFPGAVEDGYGPRRELVQVYEAYVAEGFEPQWRCESDDEFQKTFVDHYDQALQLGSDEGIEALGLAYANAISARTTCLLALVDGEPVLVLVDRIEADHDQVVAPPEGLFLHRTELARLVLYEVSPFDVPRVAPTMFLPDLASDGEGRQ